MHLPVLLASYPELKSEDAMGGHDEVFKVSAKGTSADFDVCDNLKESIAISGRKGKRIGKIVMQRDNEGEE
ncbi:hypothetical protein E5288_WYG011998 [Bos mutus]|uniref:Uncharacterized protein n=1 Tax=Bos mutus TaxID=72004 RepID=A0A6B0QZH7_9CETA|nr:hypothetical protein [Bos mutus]